MSGSRWRLWKHVFGTLAVVAVLGLLAGWAIHRASIFSKDHGDCGMVSNPSSEHSNSLDPSGVAIRCEQARLDRSAEVKVILIGSTGLLVVSVAGWLIASARLQVKQTSGIA